MSTKKIETLVLVGSLSRLLITGSESDQAIAAAVFATGALTTAWGAGFFLAT
jgi:hypothetical protein